MGKIKLFEISLSRKSNVYFTRQLVQGELVLETDRDIKVSGSITSLLHLLSIATSVLRINP